MALGKPTCMYMGEDTPVEVRRLLSKIAFSFHHVDRKDCTQAIRLGGVHPYPLSHPTGLKETFLPDMYFVFLLNVSSSCKQRAFILNFKRMSMNAHESFGCIKQIWLSNY